MVPLTRPQTVTSCAMTLPSICAPSPIRRSEARTSPLIWPKTCAEPLHSMLPTIDIPEPMQERVATFVVGSRLGGGCSTTECCCCTVLPTTSAAFAAASLSFCGALVLNMSTSVFCRTERIAHLGAAGDRCRCEILNPAYVGLGSSTTEAVKTARPCTSAQNAIRSSFQSVDCYLCAKLCRYGYPRHRGSARRGDPGRRPARARSEEHTSELQ